MTTPERVSLTQLLEITERRVRQSGGEDRAELEELMADLSRRALAASLANMNGCLIVAETMEDG